MIAQGLESLFPMEDISVMGVAEILPKLGFLLKRIRQTIDDIKDQKPDIVITIDAPDFSFRVAKALRKEMETPPKLVHYVAPTVWAWRKGRAKKIAQFLDGLMCLFPFEPPYFEEEELEAIAVGHPVIESEALNPNKQDFLDENGIIEGEENIGVFLGSRKSEIKRLGNILLETVQHVANQRLRPPHLIIPTLPHLKGQVFETMKHYSGPVHITTNPKHKWNAFASCDVAVAVSGTVALELAVVGVPHVIAFNMTSFTWEIVKRVVNVEYAHLANLMLNEEVVPEFIQPLCKPDLIAPALLELMDNQELRMAQLHKFEEVRQMLGSVERPSDKAADYILKQL